MERSKDASIELILTTLCKRLQGVVDRLPASEMDFDLRTALGEARLALAVLSSENSFGQVERQTFADLMEIAGPLAPELILQIQTDLRMTSQELSHAVATENWDGIRANTHVLMSLSGSIGAERLQALCSILNAAAQEANRVTVMSLSELVLSGLEQVNDFVSNRITTPALDSKGGGDGG